MLFADAVLEGKPYPIKALICPGGNPAVTLPDTDRIQQAMRKLDFMVVSALFMTDTAKLADIVLPACSFLEKGGVGYVYGVNTCIPYAMVRKKVMSTRRRMLAGLEDLDRDRQKNGLWAASSRGIPKKRSSTSS